MPQSPTGKAAEYVEKLVADGFKREVDQEENVVRSLPFFATSIGVLVAFLGLAAPRLPPLSGDGLSVLTYTLLFLLLASIAALIAFLFLAVRKRSFAYPMSEPDLVAYAADLQAHHAGMFASKAAEAATAVDAAEVEQAVIADLRDTHVTQLAKAAQTNRGHNEKRLNARVRAFYALTASLVFAWLLVVIILGGNALHGGSDGGHGQSGTAAGDQGVHRPPDGKSVPQAGTPADALPVERRLDLQGPDAGGSGETEPRGEVKPP